MTLRQQSGRKWPHGEGEPPASCENCNRRAWCVLCRWGTQGMFSGFICESCADELLDAQPVLAGRKP